MGPQIRIIAGNRLHLQHGPIDLIIGADGDRAAAFKAAQDRFATVLAELVTELPALREQLRHDTPRPKGEIARLMHRATAHQSATFVTCMAAVAGAVADTVMAAMQLTDITRAYVNNGGDIAVHLTQNTQFALGLASLQGTALGRVTLTAESSIRGIATSGQGGRSLSRGIATSVTVLAETAAAADVAATLIANAVDLPGHPAITRTLASDIDPDSDLRDLPVVTHVGHLLRSDVTSALAAGANVAREMQSRGLIHSAALFLADQSRIIGNDTHFALPHQRTLTDA